MRTPDRSEGVRAQKATRPQRNRLRIHLRTTLRSHRRSKQQFWCELYVATSHPPTSLLLRRYLVYWIDLIIHSSRRQERKCGFIWNLSGQESGKVHEAQTGAGREHIPPRPYSPSRAISGSRIRRDARGPPNAKRSLGLLGLDLFSLEGFLNLGLFGLGGFLNLFSRLFSCLGGSVFSLLHNSLLL